MNKHLVLVGLSGAGKSSVGRLVARTLGVDAHDIDEIIEQSVGRSVAEIITAAGEPEFRRLERLETQRVVAEPPAVVIPGGGWAAQENNLRTVQDCAFSVYLETSPTTALSRIGDTKSRPLLDVTDALSRIEELLALRKPYYESCDAIVSTEGKTLAEVAEEVGELARRAIVA